MDKLKNIPNNIFLYNNEINKTLSQENSTKNQPKRFFVLANGQQLSIQQKQFISNYYPAYLSNPNEILNWLYNEAYNIEFYKYYDDLQNQQSDDEIYTEDTKFVHQQKKKQQQQHKPVEIQKTVKQHEEIKKQKVIKDVKVTINEKTIVKVNEDKQPCSIVFIGHVDAGKSTLSGQIMLLTDRVDQRTISKFKQEAKEKNRESWWLAYCMDSFEEEKAKGKTIEVGRATFETKQKQFTIFDAPGHKTYVPNMIIGTSLADFAGLLISARKGEFEAGFSDEGQTKEHIQLAKNLGVKNIIVIVNKMDDQSVQWSKNRWDDIINFIKPILNQSGFEDEMIQYVPISAYTNENIQESISKKYDWYQGKTLLEILDQTPIKNHEQNDQLRIPILDKTKDQSVFAHGKIQSGILKIGDKLIIQPTGYQTQVGQILDHKNESVEYARPGENVQIKLLQIEDENIINKGDVIIRRNEQIPITTIFEAEIQVYQLLEHKPIISNGYSCILHCHMISIECQIKNIICSFEQNTTTKEIVKKDLPKFIKQNVKAIVRIEVKQPIAIEKFSINEQLGRIILRDEGATIASGTITKYKQHI